MTFLLDKDPRQWVERWGTARRGKCVRVRELSLKSGGQMEERWRNKQIIMIEIMLALMIHHVMNHWHCPMLTGGLLLNVRRDILFFIYLFFFHLLLFPSFQPYHTSDLISCFSFLVQYKCRCPDSLLCWNSRDVNTQWSWKRKCSSGVWEKQQH